MSETEKTPIERAIDFAAMRHMSPQLAELATAQFAALREEIIRITLERDSARAFGRGTAKMALELASAIENAAPGRKEGRSGWDHTTQPQAGAAPSFTVSEKVAHIEHELGECARIAKEAIPDTERETPACLVGALATRFEHEREARKINLRRIRELEEAQAHPKATAAALADVVEYLHNTGVCESPSCLIWGHLAQLLRQRGFANGEIFDEHFKGTSLEC